MGGPHDIQTRRGIVVFDKEQRFPVKAAITSMGLLLLSCLSFALPSMFPVSHCHEVLMVSRIGSVIVASCYVAFLLFQLVTHSRTLADEEQAVQNENVEDEEEASLTVWCSVALMMVSALLVSANS